MIANIDSIKKDFCETGELEMQLAACDAEIAGLADTMQKCIDENERQAQGQEEYLLRFSELEEQYDSKSAEHDQLKEEIKQKKAKAAAIDEFTACRKKQVGKIEEFDMALWSSLVDYATVYDRENIVFTFVNGAKIKA